MGDGYIHPPILIRYHVREADLTRYIFRRLLSVIPTLIGVTFVIFMFQRLIPGDPAVAMLGEHAAKENVERIREQLGLNRPLFLDREALANGDLAGFFDSQYIRYLGRLATIRSGRFDPPAHPGRRNACHAFPGHSGAGSAGVVHCYYYRHPGWDRLGGQAQLGPGWSKHDWLVDRCFNANLLVGANGDHAFCGDFEVAANRWAAEHGDRD